MKILVTGSTGFIGSALIEDFKDILNYKIVALVRPSSTKEFQDGIDVRVGELCGPNALDFSLDDIDVIIHAAGSSGYKSQNQVNDFLDINTFATIKLAKKAISSGVKQFIFLSSIKVNGESTSIGAPFKRSSSSDPRDAYGVSKHEAEKGLKEIANSSKLNITIVRPPLVYGAGVKGNFATLIKLINMNVPIPLGSVNKNRRSMVSKGNLISLLKACIMNPKAVNQTFLVSDNNDLSTYELIRLLAFLKGKSAIMLPIPLGILSFISKLFGIDDKAQKLLGTLQVDISDTMRILDWKPPEKLIEALRLVNNKDSNI